MREVECTVWNNRVRKVGTVVVPESPSEMIELVGEQKMFRFALKGFMLESKRMLKSGLVPGRKKVIKLKIKSLNAEQVAALTEWGFLPSNG